MEEIDVPERKISHVLLGMGAAFIIKLLLFTLRWDRAAAKSAREFIASGNQYHLAFWHGRLLGLLDFGSWIQPVSKRKLVMLISQHGDGRLIAEAIKWFGIGSVAGSSSRGGREAVVKLLKVARLGMHLGITPDGPRGPRHECKPGLITVAKKSGLKILPIVFSSERAWRLKSWDGMVIPKPFSRAIFMYGEPIAIGHNEDVEEARKRVEQAITTLTEKADAVWTSA